jgi:RNA polymerase sigma-70 factor (ECF subfamily)
VLDPNVVLHVDGGPNAPPPFTRPPLVGAEAVARGAVSFRGGPYIAPVIVNGAPGVLVQFPARLLLGAFTVASGRIVEIDLIADPDKLRELPESLARNLANRLQSERRRQRYAVG